MKCDMCGQKDQDFVLDHCHGGWDWKCDMIRGWICRSCNHKLSKARCLYLAHIDALSPDGTWGPDLEYLRGSHVPRPESCREARLKPGAMSYTEWRAAEARNRRLMGR
jgi:Recombination endonuclease VII